VNLSTDQRQSAIIGLGTAVPRQAVTQAEALAMSSEISCENERQRRIMRMMFRKSGVNTRRTVIPWKTAYFWNDTAGSSGRGPGTGDRMMLYEQFAPGLAGKACRRALGMTSNEAEITKSVATAATAGAVHTSCETPRQAPSSSRFADPRGQVVATGEADVQELDGIESDGFGPFRQPLGIDPGSITHLVTVSCTGFAAPGLDWYLFDDLGLSPTVQRVQVGFMGCHGAINGLRTARGLAAADPQAVVLLCAVELCSLHYRMRWDDEAMIGNALFADGAAAAVIVGEKHQSARPEAVSSERGLRIVDCGSVRIPRSDDQMSWRIGDHGFDMTLTGQVPASIQSHLQHWMKDWLAPHGLSLDDIADWIVHPGGPRILDATESALALSPQKLQRSRDVLSELGNMSSPTVFFVLQRSLKAQQSGPRVMVAFGPGLVAEAALIDG
jgi:predicted naringenin-chalcone synthase